MEMLRRENDSLLIRVDQLQFYKYNYTESEKIFNDRTKSQKNDMAAQNF